MKELRLNLLDITDSETIDLDNNRKKFDTFIRKLKAQKGISRRIQHKLDFINEYVGKYITSNIFIYRILKDICTFFRIQNRFNIALTLSKEEEKNAYNYLKNYFIFKA